MDRPRVLFMCTHNSARSQMAEGFLRALAGDEFEVFSAGLEPTAVDPLAVEVMEERGIDISGQRSKGLDEFLGKTHFSFLVTVCDRAEQECPIFPGMGTRLHWSFDDPALAKGGTEARLEVFREVRHEIESRIRSWLADATSPAGV